MFSKPTSEMEAYFEERTRQHNERVRCCLHKLANEPEFSCFEVELNERAAVHDDSKFSAEEREPYIWLTELHRCRRAGEPFDYPAGVEQQVHEAVKHHVTTNRHHPEFHTDPDHMTPVDLIEMVCDWTAMAEEFQEPQGSARSWADKSIGIRLVLNESNRRLIYRVIDCLENECD